MVEKRADKLRVTIHTSEVQTSEIIRILTENIGLILPSTLVKKIQTLLRVIYFRHEQKFIVYLNFLLPVANILVFFLKDIWFRIFVVQ